MGSRYPNIDHSPRLTPTASLDQLIQHTASKSARLKTHRSLNMIQPSTQTRIMNGSVSTTYSTPGSYQKEYIPASKNFSSWSHYHSSQTETSNDRPSPTYKNFQRKVGRTNTDMLVSNADQVMSKVKDIKQNNIHFNKKHQISETNFRLYSIQRNLRPGTQHFRVKKLKSSTLLSSCSSTKATMNFLTNSTSPLAKPKRQTKQRNSSITSVDSEERYALGSETGLSSLYKQSIRIQTYLRQHHKSSSVLENKLSEISKLISKEQARLGKAYYAL